MIEDLSKHLNQQLMIVAHEDKCMHYFVIIKQETEIFIYVPEKRFS